MLVVRLEEVQLEVLVDQVVDITQVQQVGLNFVEQQILVVAVVMVIQAEEQVVQE